MLAAASTLNAGFEAQENTMNTRKRKDKFYYFQGAGRGGNFEESYELVAENHMWGGQGRKSDGKFINPSPGLVWTPSCTSGH